MSGIKGVVILTRFDFIENKFGKDNLKKFQKKIEPSLGSIFQQPIGISNDYSESVLQIIDDALLANLFDGKIEKFMALGRWNAHVIMPRYFQLYMDNQDAAGFLHQMMRMRSILIGLGEMQISEFERNTFGIHINYGQPYSESVKLSELGFLEESCRMCGTKNLQHEQIKTSDISVDYQLSWD